MVLAASCRFTLNGVVLIFSSNSQQKVFFSKYEAFPLKFLEKKLDTFNLCQPGKLYQLINIVGYDQKL